MQAGDLAGARKREMGEPSLSRYEIRRVLGKGGTGTVYEAFDTRTHAVVALKTVESSIAENVYRLKHEFRVLTDVQHQNLVHFGELACEDGTWFFTMEMIAGSSFIDYVRPHVTSDAPTRRETIDVDPDIVTKTVVCAFGSNGAGARPSSSETAAMVVRGGPSYDEPLLRRTLAQLVEALSALHQAGHVHRDVKPSNVLVSREGRVVLLDFGLVFALAAGSTAPADHMGTPAYMAPEQIIEGVAVGAAADWYAVGTMMYLALTGRLPFASGCDLLEAKLERTPRPPHELVPGVPADLDALCIDLLERDPKRRPSEDQIRARLGLPPRAHATGTATAMEIVPPFVGRTREREVLAAAADDVQHGSARAVVIEGEPGVGKSALVHQFLSTLGPGPVILTGRCYEQEDVPFKGVDSIIDALSEHLLTRPDDEVAALLAGGVRYLAAVFPVLRRVPAIRAATWTERGVASPTALREQAFGECERLFAALARDRLLIVFIDDLQWADADSLALLDRCTLSASGASCLFLATLRSGVELTAPAAKLRAGASVLVLSGLPDDDARALWTSLCPPALGPALPPPSERETAVREAAGHPLFLAELARAARTGRLHGGAALLDVLRDRIDHHDTIEQRFLEVAALAGAPMPYQIVARTAELDVGTCLTRIGGLKAAQLLRVTLDGDERCVEPYHDRIREAIMERLRNDPDRMAGLHLRLGRSLLDATPTEVLPGRVFPIVQHLNAARRLLHRANERVRIAKLNLLAARQALLATAYDRARECTRAGLELIAQEGWARCYALSRDLHLVRMQAEYLAGDRDGARAVFDAARPHLTSAADTAALWAAWIILETGKGRFREALEAGRDGLGALDYELPNRPSHDDVLRQYAATRRARRSRTPTELEALPLLSDARRRGVLQLLMATGPVAFFIDTNLLAWINMRIAEETMRHGLSEVAPFGFAGYGMILAGVFDRHADGVELGELALRLNERFDNPGLAAKLYVQNGAFLTHWVRPFAEAKAHLRTAHELGIQHGDAAYEVYAATIFSVVTFCESTELAAVQETAEWAREVAARRKIKDMAAVPDIHARHAAALRGLTPSPRDLGDASMTDETFRATLGDTPVAIFYYYFCNAELAFLAGDWQRAVALLAEAETRRQGIFSIPTTVELCFLGALVAARQADERARRARAELVADLRARCRRLDGWAESAPANYRVQALIARAELSRVRGRHRDAARSYQAAAATARNLGNPKREALALELAARAAGDPAEAARLRSQAADAYRRWGAITKADALAAISEPSAT